MSLELCRERILSEEFRDFLVGRLQEDLFQEKFGNVDCEMEMGEFYRSIYVDNELAEPIRFDKYPYNSIPKCYTLLDTEALADAGIYQVQNYPTLELQGTGVMVGFVDTGIDYQNPLFRNLDGSSRIVGIWDQTIQDGNPPEGFLYGTEYRKDDIDIALQSENPLELVSSRDENSHGTFLASIATGGAVPEEQFIGAAPDAQIAVVKLKQAKQYLKEFYLIDANTPCYQENDIMLGITYLHNLARERNLPLVLCIALGTNQGSHTAGSPLTGILDIFANTDHRAVVIGAGNEADQRHHFWGRIEREDQEQEVEIQVSEGNKGFCMELWASSLNLFEVSITSPSGESSYQFPIRGGRTQEYTFVFERTQISIDYKVFVERLNATLIFMRISNPTEGIWKVTVHPVRIANGEYHIWLPVKEFLSSEVFFLESNPNYTMTEPGSALSGITVGFYDGRDNSIAIQSGRGYTRDERIKPDFVAPGVNVKGAISRNQFAVRTGSSIATGITAGAVALLMEWGVYVIGEIDLDSSQIRNLLILGTEKTEGTTYPNQTSGYGRLNLYQTFEFIRQI